MDRASPVLHPVDELVEDAPDQLDLSVEGEGGHAGTDESGGEVAAEEAEPLDHAHRGAISGGGDGGTQAGGTTTDNEDVGRLRDRDLAGVLHG